MTKINKTKTVTFTQSNRNLTRAERSVMNCMVREGYENPEINLALAGVQADRGLPLRLVSDGYLDRVRSQFRQFQRQADRGRPAARYGIDMLEAGYSWSGKDSSYVADRLGAGAAAELRRDYLNERNEAIR